MKFVSFFSLLMYSDLNFNLISKFNLKWICTVLLVVSASAAKLPGDVAIVSSNSVMNLDGSYEFR